MEIKDEKQLSSCVWQYLYFNRYEIQENWLFMSKTKPMTTLKCLSRELVCLPHTVYANRPSSYYS